MTPAETWEEIDDDCVQLCFWCDDCSHECAVLLSEYGFGDLLCPLCNGLMEYSGCRISTEEYE